MGIKPFRCSWAYPMVFISADPTKSVCVYIVASNNSNTVIFLGNVLLKWTFTNDYLPFTYISIECVWPIILTFIAFNFCRL